VVGGTPAPEPAALRLMVRLFALGMIFNVLQRNDPHI
jgi:hypothetical protein